MTKLLIPLCALVLLLTSGVGQGEERQARANKGMATSSPSPDFMSESDITKCEYCAVPIDLFAVEPFMEERGAQGEKQEIIRKGRP